MVSHVGFGGKPPAEMVLVAIFVGWLISFLHLRRSTFLLVLPAHDLRADSEVAAISERHYHQLWRELYYECDRRINARRPSERYGYRKRLIVECEYPLGDNADAFDRIHRGSNDGCFRIGKAGGGVYRESLQFYKDDVITRRKVFERIGEPVEKFGRIETEFGSGKFVPIRRPSKGRLDDGNDDGSEYSEGTWDPFSEDDEDGSQNSDEGRSDDSEDIENLFSDDEDLKQNGLIRKFYEYEKAYIDEEEETM